MKKSKLILFSYIGFLALLFLVFVIFLTSTDDERRAENDDKFAKATVELPDFAYVKINQQNMSISSGESNLATVTYPKDSLKPEIVWRMDGDTLCLDASDKYHNLKLKFSNRALLQAKVSKASIYFSDLQVDTLLLHGKEAKFNGFNKTNLKFLELHLSSSRMHNYNGNVEAATVDMLDSHVVLNKTVDRVKGKLRSKSSIQVRKVKRINLDLDESSKLRSY